MPLYEYQCECGALLETLESAGTARFSCGELCKKTQESAIQPGLGSVTRVLSSSSIRGDGKDAKQKEVKSTGQVKRPYSDCQDCHCDK